MGHYYLKKTGNIGLLLNYKKYEDMVWFTMRRLVLFARDQQESYNGLIYAQNNKRINNIIYSNQWQPLAPGLRQKHTECGKVKHPS